MAYDDEVADLAPPVPLTSVAPPPKRDVGHAAVAMCMERLGGKTGSSVSAALRRVSLAPEADHPGVHGVGGGRGVGAGFNLLAEVLAEPGDCEVHLAVAGRLDQARSDEPVPILGNDVGLGLEDGADLTSSRWAFLEGHRVEELAVSF